jgi:hypothetical protein
VQEDSSRWEFVSINYNLLCAVYVQIPIDSKPTFLWELSLRMASPEGLPSKVARYSPSWYGLVSEFPLVAEFCVRHGATQMVFENLGNIHLRPASVILLQHIEDMIALNFTIFADAEYVFIESRIAALISRAHQAFESAERSYITILTGKEIPARNLFLEIIESAKGILEESRKARYFYLKARYSMP